MSRFSLPQIREDDRGLIVILLILLSICLPFFSYVPLWDGLAYVRCIFDHSVFPFTVENARCFGHPSIAYVWYQRFVGLLTPHSVVMLYVGNFLLVSTSVVLFQRLLRHLFAELSSMTLTLYTSLFAFAPLLTMHIFNVAPDLGVACFLMMYLSTLLRGKYWLAGLTGFALAFSKEAGTAIYVASVILLSLFIAPSWYQSRSIKDFLQECKKFLPVLLPSVPLVGYIIYYATSGGTPFWKDYAWASFDWSTFSSLYENPQSLFIYLLHIFVLNFQWVFVLAGLCASCVFFLRLAGDALPTLQKGHTARFLFILCMFVASVVIVTRVRPFNNPRYVILCLPFLPLLFPYALTCIRVRPSLRDTFLSCFVTLMLLLNFLTIDPLSRYAYGTFSAGRFRMLNMNQAGASVGAYGRDELAYNMEFIMIGDAFRRVVQTLQPSPATVIFVGYGLRSMYEFDTSLFVDASTSALQLQPHHTFPLTIIDSALPQDLDASLHGADRSYFISFPQLQNLDMMRELQLRATLVEHPTNFGHGVRLYSLQ